MHEAPVYDMAEIPIPRSFGILSILCGALYLVNIFLPKVKPLNSILMVAALVFSVVLLISHLCYLLSKDDKK